MVASCVHFCAYSCVHVYLQPLVIFQLKYSNKVTSLTFLQRTNVIIVNLEKKKSAAGGPQLRSRTCSLAQDKVRRSGCGETWHAGTVVHRGQLTGSPQGFNSTLLAHRLLPRAGQVALTHTHTHKACTLKNTKHNTHREYLPN